MDSGKGEESPTLAPKEAAAVKEKGQGDHEKEDDDSRFSSLLAEFPREWVFKKSM